MIGDEKEVYFNQYCPKCKFKDVDEHDPEGECWDCLESPTNVDSHKPINFKEAKKFIYSKLEIENSQIKAIKKLS